MNLYESANTGECIVNGWEPGAALRIHGGNLRKAALQYGFKEKDIIDFSANVNPLGMPSSARRAAKRAVSRAGVYPDPDVTLFRRAVARYFGVKPEHVVAGSGATSLIHLIPRVLKPRRVLIPMPTFTEYAVAAFDAGCEVVPFLLEEDKGFRIDPLDLSFALKGLDMAILCNPNNPTGGLISKPEMLEIAAYCMKEGIRLVVDEAFMDFAEQESIVKDATQSPNIICLRAFTKFFGMPGLRVGCAIANEETAAMLMAGQEPWPLSAPAEAAVQAALGDLRYIKKSRKLITRERERLLSELRLLQGVETFPCSANFILIKVSKPSERGIAHDLALRGILVRDCSSFPGLDNRFIRIAVRKRRDNNKLLSALRAILIAS